MPDATAATAATIWLPMMAWGLANQVTAGRPMAACTYWAETIEPHTPSMSAAPRPASRTAATVASSTSEPGLQPGRSRE